MKVAIIGAGIAGLSCAHELERHGIRATIYEQNHYIGENYSHVGTILEIANRPVRRPLEYLKLYSGLDIKPINTVNKVKHISPHKTTVITGKLGYFLDRSKAASDIKVQLYSKLKNTNVLFSTLGDYESLSKKKRLCHRCKRQFQLYQRAGLLDQLVECLYSLCCCVGKF